MTENDIKNQEILFRMGIVDEKGKLIERKRTFEEQNNTPSNRTSEYWAINIDFKKLSNYDLTKCVFIIDNILNTNLNFVIEEKKKNGNIHMHSYIKGYDGLTETKLHKIIAKYFKGFSFKIKPVFDLEGWKSYMLKCSKKIIQTRPDEN